MRDQGLTLRLCVILMFPGDHEFWRRVRKTGQVRDIHPHSRVRRVDQEHHEQQIFR